MDDRTNLPAPPPSRDLRPPVRVLAVAAAILGSLIAIVAVTEASGTRGGRLYDRWWTELGLPAPTGDHPLYPAIGAQSGSTTYRCKECHGWDYRGAAGAYGSGSHFTGIPGVLGSSLTPAAMFDIIKNPDGDGTGGTTVHGHGFGALGLSDTDIQDLVDMLGTLLVDTDLVIDDAGVFLGDPVAGEGLFAGIAGCVLCHGPDGNWIDFGTPGSPEYVGTVAAHNPWEFVHKVRFGQPGTVMPSWIDSGGDLQGVADIGRYAQSLPTGACGWVLGDTNGDGSTDIADAILIFSHLFLSGPAPVPQVEVGDVNADGGVDIGDGIHLLEYLFDGGAPLLPSPSC